MACWLVLAGRVGGDDRGQVAVREPGEAGGVAERPVDPLGAVQAGQLDRFGHLHLHAAGARGGGLDQPQPGAFSQRQELVRLGAAVEAKRELANSSTTSQRTSANPPNGCDRSGDSGDSGGTVGDQPPTMPSSASTIEPLGTGTHGPTGLVERRVITFAASESPCSSIWNSNAMVSPGRSWSGCRT
jgi:hypothetical protein